MYDLIYMMLLEIHGLSTALKTIGSLVGGSIIKKHLT